MTPVIGLAWFWGKQLGSRTYKYLQPPIIDERVATRRLLRVSAELAWAQGEGNTNGLQHGTSYTPSRNGSAQLWLLNA